MRKGESTRDGTVRATTRPAPLDHERGAAPNVSVDSGRRPRIGLVLGAGGAVGASYLAGALEGVRRASGFVASDAHVVVGTSAGAFIGTLASSIPTPALYAHCGDAHHEIALSENERARIAAADAPNQRPLHTRYPPSPRLPRPFLSSPRAVARGLAKPGRTTLEMVLMGLLGEGIVSTRLVGDIVSSALAGAHQVAGAAAAEASAPNWPHARLWITACDLESGRRVVFGRDGEGTSLPDVTLAVRASVAIPGLFAPVVIDGRRHVDAGPYSVSNLDLVADEPLDAVLCINPLSRTAPGPNPPRRAPWDHIVHGVLDAAGRRIGARLEREIRRVEARGIPVFVLHPTHADRAIMPLNSMSMASRAAVVRMAARTVEHTLLHDPALAPVLGLLRRGADAARAPALHS